MNEHYEQPSLPQNLQIQIANFIINMQIYAKLQGTQVLRVQLHKKQKPEDVFIYEIDENQLRANNSLSFFQRPSNLYYEIISAQRDIKVSDFGQISFYVSLGKKSKYMVNLNAVRRREQAENQNLNKVYQAEFTKTLELCEQYADKIVKVMGKAIELKRLNEMLPVERKYGLHLQFENYLQSKHLKYNSQIKEAILREMQRNESQ